MFSSKNCARTNVMPPGDIFSISMQWNWRTYSRRPNLTPQCLHSHVVCIGFPSWVYGGFNSSKIDCLNAWLPKNVFNFVRLVSAQTNHCEYDRQSIDHHVQERVHSYALKLAIALPQGWIEIWNTQIRLHKELNMECRTRRTTNSDLLDPLLFILLKSVKTKLVRTKTGWDNSYLEVRHSRKINICRFVTSRQVTMLPLKVPSLNSSTSIATLLTSWK